MTEAERLRGIRDAKAERDRTDEGALAANRALTEAITAALEAGVRVKDVAEAAGISRQRLHQIKKGQPNNNRRGNAA